MKNFIKKIANIGLGEESNIIECRRIRLLNTFSLVITIFIVIYVVMNFVVEAYSHAALIFSSFFILILPVYFFAYQQYHKISRAYFVIGTLLVLNVVGYYSISNFDDRHNEVFFIGFSALIVILYDNYLKIIFFVIAILCCLTMYLVRWEHLGVSYNVDAVLSFTNVITSFVCVYVFTSLFKKDLLKSINQVHKYSSKLEQQQAEITIKNNDLIANKQLLRSLIDNIPIFLTMIDLDGNYIVANKKYRSVFVKEIEEIEGKNASLFLNKKMNEVQNLYMEMCLRGEDPEFDRAIILPNGENIHIYGKIIPIHDDNKKVKGFIQYGTDVTKLKQVENELKELNETKNKLLSIVSHDLKGPINSLKALLYLSDSLTVDVLKELMVEIRNQIDSVLFTMDNLLTWVRSQFEGFEIAPQHFDIYDVAKHSIDLHKEQLKVKNIKINLEESRNVIVYSDKDSMYLVCRNLINNAIKFTPHQGQITLSCTRESDHSVMSVIDNGIGMSQENIAIIMNDAKQNITNKGTEGEVGTGLGLAFCKDVLKMNNAHMEIESVIGQGTEVRIIFPNT